MRRTATPRPASAEAIGNSLRGPGGGVARRQRRPPGAVASARSPRRLFGRDGRRRERRFPAVFRCGRRGGRRSVTHRTKWAPGGHGCCGRLGVGGRRAPAGRVRRGARRTRAHRACEGATSTRMRRRPSPGRGRRPAVRGGVVAAGAGRPRAGPGAELGRRSRGFGRRRLRPGKRSGRGNGRDEAAAGQPAMFSSASRCHAAPSAAHPLRREDGSGRSRTPPAPREPTEAGRGHRPDPYARNAAAPDPATTRSRHVHDGYFVAVPGVRGRRHRHAGGAIARRDGVPGPPRPPNATAPRQNCHRFQPSTPAAVTRRTPRRSPAALRSPHGRRTAIRRVPGAHAKRRRTSRRAVALGRVLLLTPRTPSRHRAPISYRQKS